MYWLEICHLDFAWHKSIPTHEKEQVWRASQQTVRTMPNHQLCLTFMQTWALWQILNIKSSAIASQPSNYRHGCILRLPCYCRWRMLIYWLYKRSVYLCNLQDGSTSTAAARPMPSTQSPESTGSPTRDTWAQGTMLRFPAPTRIFPTGWNSRQYGASTTLVPRIVTRWCRWSQIARTPSAPLSSTIPTMGHHNLWVSGCQSTPISSATSRLPTPNNRRM